MKRIINILVLLAVCMQAMAQTPDSRASIYVKLGTASRMGKATGNSEVERQHAQKLSKGLSAQFELVLNSPSIITAGFIVNDFHATAKDRVVVTYSNGSQATGDMIDIADIWTFAPATYLRGTTLGNRLGLFLGVGMGVMGLRDKGTLIDYSVIKSGWSMAGVTEVGMDYKLTPALSLGLASNLIVGNLTSYKTKELSTGNIQKTSNVSESISHIDLLLSLSYAF